MKKIALILFSLFINTLCSYSQNGTYYVDKGKMYYFNWSDYNLVYVANYSASYETTYGEHITAEKICIFENSNIESYTSSHGEYVEIEHAQYGGTNAFDYCVSRNMLFYVTGYGICAFTKKNNTLSLIKFYDDKIISVIDNNFSEGSDFSILVKDMSRPNNVKEPSFWILNNGYLKYYSNVSNYASSINNSIKKDSNSSRIYNMNGIEIETPRHEIFIQNGKKKTIK